MAYGPKLLKVDLSEMRKLEKDLDTFKAKAMPYATRETVNEQAFTAQRLWKQELPKKLTLRNKYTERSIRVDKTHSLNVNQQVAVVGSRAEYMDEVEQGETRTGKKHGAPVPTLAARIGGSNARLVSRPNKLRSIRFKGTRGKSRKQRNAIAISQAKKSSTPYAFLDLGSTKGIFKIPKGSKAKPKLIWSLGKKTIRTKPHPTMPTAVEEATQMGPSIFREAMIKQLRRHRIPGC